MGQCDECLVVAFALGSFLVVVGPAGRVEPDRGEGREEQRPLEAFVAGMADAFGLDRGARLSGGRRQSGVGGQCRGASEGFAGDLSAMMIAAVLTETSGMDVRTG